MLPSPARAAVFAFLLTAAATAQMPDDVVLTTAMGSQSSPFSRPVWLGEIPGKEGFFLVAEQTGNLVLVEGAGASAPRSTFLSLSVRTGANEAGLLGVAFHPDFESNRKYYVNYMPPAGGEGDVTYIEERTANEDVTEDSGEEPRRILSVPQPAANHNGGTLAFGPDGYLYAGFGDDGDASKMSSLQGKMLRIDVDEPDDGKAYGIPSDNPFADASDASIRKEIWAHGFRNPWKFSFDPVTGDLWVGDVGENKFEEVDIVRKGENMGWPTMEGTHCLFYTGTEPNCDKSPYVLPVVDFERQDAVCVIGGFVYRGNTESPFYGAYIFSDLSTRNLFALKQEDREVDELTVIGTAPAEVTSLGTDRLGNLYILTLTGRISKLEHPLLRPSSTALPRFRPRPPSLSVRRLPGGLLLNASRVPDGWVCDILGADGRPKARVSAADLRTGYAFRAEAGAYLARLRGPGASPTSRMLILP